VLNVGFVKMNRLESIVNFSGFDYDDIYGVNNVNNSDGNGVGKSDRNIVESISDDKNIIVDECIIEILNSHWNELVNFNFDVNRCSNKNIFRDDANYELLLLYVKFLKNGKLYFSKEFIRLNSILNEKVFIKECSFEIIDIDNVDLEKLAKMENYIYSNIDFIFNFQEFKNYLNVLIRLSDSDYSRLGLVLDKDDMVDLLYNIKYNNEYYNFVFEIL
jgi:hypothetical protein